MQDIRREVKRTMALFDRWEAERSHTAAVWALEHAQQNHSRREAQAKRVGRENIHKFSARGLVRQAYVRIANSHRRGRQPLWWDTY